MFVFYTHRKIKIIQELFNEMVSSAYYLLAIELGDVLKKLNNFPGCQGQRVIPDSARPGSGRRVFTCTDSNSVGHGIIHA